MAEVFRAQEPRPAGEPRLVAVKRMLPALAEDPKSRTMFAEEARLGGRVMHDNVVDVLGYGEEGGRPYLVLEYVPGVDLWRMMRTLIRDGQQVSISMTVFIMRALLRGLQAVHEAQTESGESLLLVHRDISPSNVLLSIRGEVKVSDFGIALSGKGISGTNGPLTDRAKGKLGYLAPEQVTGEKVDRRADVFSAAVIAAELLMGRPLFAGGSELAVLLAIRDAEIHPFVERTETLPAGLGELIQKALSRTPEARLSTAQEFSERLAPFMTEDLDALCEELSQMVKRSIEVSRTPVPEPLSQALHASDATPMVPIPADDSEGVSTRESPVVSFEVLKVDGSPAGTYTYAAMVEAISTGRLGPADRLREIDPEARPSVAPAFRPIGGIPALNRHFPPSTMTPRTAEQQQPDAPDEAVSLTNGGIVVALSLSAMRADTGLWLCEAGGVRKEIYIQEGTPEFVTSNVAQELLGEFLVAQGVITRSELDMALAVMPRFEGRLGETLRALGLVDPVPLFQHIGEQIRQKLLDLFRWNVGSASFYRGVPPPPTNFPPGLDAWQLILEGMKLRLQEGVEEEPLLLPSPNVRRTARGADLASEPNLAPELRMILALLETPQPTSVIVSESAAPDGIRRGLAELLVLDRLGAIAGIH